MKDRLDQNIAVVESVETPPQTSRLSWAVQGKQFGDYVAITKPEITFLVALSSVAGFALGSIGPINLPLLVVTVIGTVFASAGASALNHYVERDRDSLMKRTAGRPVPSGRIQALHARNFGIALTGAGLGILCPLVNPLTAVLAGVTVVLYVFVYTPLKQKTPVSTLIGTLPGALPVVGGYAAATNSIGGTGAWALFALLACWQMPHFLSLAWMYRKDYTRGGFAMLCVNDPSGSRTVTQTAGFTAATIATSLLLAPLGGLGAVYVTVAILAAFIMIRPVVDFVRTRGNGDARRVLKASVMYIPIIVLAILLDRLV